MGEVCHAGSAGGGKALSNGPPGSLDARYAHKPCVVEKDGVWYHFYCAVSEDNYRCISLATSEDLGVET